MSKPTRISSQGSADKDTEIRTLKQQVEELQTKSSSNENQLKKLLATQSGAEAADQLEALDTVRSHIVSLALALERSENNRADALGRLVSERETHAGSLKSMSENVKRFYSTLSFADA